ncbi:MAG: bifunctional DNA primase/polymerase [Anaerolineae bacterium]|nr:bifunctional DNA primase/polymerase [Anaerolineae bacterium]
MADLETPTIVKAARSRSSFYAALLYHVCDISVLPCNGKIPAVDWRALQYRAAGSYQIMKWSDDGLFGNVGVICGAVSDHLVVMDLDGDKAIEAFALTFPELTATYTVRTGSGHGKHLYFYARRLPPTTRVVGTVYGNIELRANGCYVIAPPSIHPVTGIAYALDNAVRPLTVDHLDDVVTWIKRLMAEKNGGSLPPATSRTNPVRQATRWAQAALADECRKVRSAPEGGQNVQLNLSAFKLGQLVANRVIDRLTVEETLYDAAVSSGYVARDGAGAARRTIASGLNAGMSPDKARPNARRS